ncbi:DUF2244 domain-containing protein [Chelatococcus reniformis]|uniref:Membrane protein n=1 Tax=Chelatococcus reniformis TaxID=1494448 RepID=A0A916XN39_9HYPH|nr:DUF2244 domain-containing protein [Chelatococcus reniformis]GGC86165.1 membrane protein [Chelatococcus reniformis]
MNAMSSRKQEAGEDERVFAATITPHRSLGANAFRLVMGLMLLASVVSSLPFVIMGAWPVAGFFGLDVLALYIAFRVSFHRSRAFEEVILTRVQLLLRKVSPKGTAAEWRFNPVWTRLDRANDPEFGLLRLAVVSRGERVPIAQALSAGERESFADALGQALAQARRGEIR